MEFDSRVFDQFAEESKQDVSKAMQEMGTKHINFSGHYQRGNKEGKGAFQDSKTGDFFFGHF